MLLDAIEERRERSGSAAWVRAADMKTIANRFTELAWKGGPDNLKCMQDMVTTMAKHTGGNNCVNAQNKNGQTVSPRFSHTKPQHFTHFHMHIEMHVF